MEESAQPSGTGQSSGWDPSAKAKDLAYLVKLQGLLERRLRYHRGRGDRVGFITDELADAASFDSEARSILALGARFHDVGLLGIPDALLQTDRTLTPAERQAVNEHVSLGGQLMNLGYSDCPELLEIVWFHHERADGHGPLGVAGELIPESARMVSLAAAVESMYCGRPHRPPLASAQIMSELRRCAGTQFDEQTVRLFSRVQERVFTGLGESRQAEQESRERSAARASAAMGGRRTTADAGQTEAAKTPLMPGQPADVSTRLESVATLTALPTAVCEILMLAGSQYADRQELTRAIEQDVSLSSKILALANSAAYGRKRTRVTTIEEAVANLGFDVIKNMATGMGVLREVGGESEGTPQYVKLWEHSFATALIAGMLAPGGAESGLGSSYVAGLLHDLGKFVVLEFFPEEIGALLKAGNLSDEAETLGADHARLGAKLLSHWNIPVELTRPVREHHTEWADAGRYTEDERAAILTVQISDGLASVLGFDSGFLDYLPCIPDDALQLCHALEKLDPAELKQTVQEQMQEAKLLLGMFQEPSTVYTADDTPALENRPPISYVSVEPARVEFLRLWLEHGQGYTLQACPLSDAEEQIDGRSLVVVDLSGGTSQANAVARLRDLVKCPQGVVIAADHWWEQIFEAASEGWHALHPPLTLSKLDAVLRQASATKFPKA